jgi:hypothetical protein
MAGEMEEKWEDGGIWKKLGICVSNMGGKVVH